MRNVTLPAGSPPPEPRATEVVVEGGSAAGFNNWLILNDEDSVPRGVAREVHRRAQRKIKEAAMMATETL